MLITSLLFVFKLITFSLTSSIINLSQNSSGLYLEESLLNNTPLQLNDIVNHFLSFEIIFTIDSENLIVKNELQLISQNLTIISKSTNSRISLILIDFASIIIENQSIFKLLSVDIEVHSSQMQAIVVLSNSAFILIESQLKEINDNIKYFCIFQESSLAHIENFTLKSLTITYNENFVLFFGINSVFELVYGAVENNYFNNFAFLQSLFSECIISKLNFLNNFIKNNEIMNIFNLDHYAIINQSNFSNNSFDSCLIYFLGNEISESNFYISSSNFVNNSGITSFKTILMKNNEKVNFFISSYVLILSHISVYSSIMIFVNINQLSFISSEFIENISINLISLLNINTLLLEKTVFQNNNNVTSSSLSLNNIGYCIKIENFNNITMNECLLLNSYANFTLPGFFIYNDIIQLQILNISNSIFSNNLFFHENALNSSSHGCIFHVINTYQIYMNQVFFSNNVLLDDNYGGISLYYDNGLSLDVNLAFYLGNYDFTDSIIFQGNINNISINNSLFLENSGYSSFFITGYSQYLTMNNCLLINNNAYQGLFYFIERNFLIMSLNSVSMFYNQGYLTTGILGMNEIVTRSIYWGNSEFKANVHNYGQGTMFIVMLNINFMTNFNLTVDNFNLSDNETPNNADLLTFSFWSVTVNIKFKNVIVRNNILSSPIPENALFDLFGFTKSFKIYVEDTMFDDNYSYDSFIVGSFVKIYFKNVVFNNNSCITNSLFYFYHSQVSISNMNITNNIILYFYLMIFTQFSIGNISDISFISNIIPEGCFASLDLNSFSISNINIIDTILHSNSFVFYLKASVFDIIENINLVNVTAENFLFTIYSQANIATLNYTNCKLSYMFNTRQSEIFFNDSFLLFVNDFKNLHEKINLFIIETSNISLYMIKINSFANDYYSKFTLLNSEIIIIKSNFINFTFVSKTYLFLITNSKIFSDDSNFLNSNNVLYSKMSEIKLINSSFSDFTSEFLSTTDHIITCFDSLSFQMISNVFTNILLNSSIVFLTGSPHHLNEIINCSFFNNVCFDCSGGVIFVSNTNVSFNQNIFQSNQANYGGALYLECTQNQFINCQYYLNNNIFISNHAVFGGGAYKWEIKEPIEFNSTFLNNSAQYGNDYTSFFCRLGLQIYDQIDNNSLIYDSFFSNNTNNTNNFFVLTNVLTEIIFPFTLKFFAIDTYSQIIYDNITTNIQISTFDNGTFFDQSDKFKEAISNLDILNKFYCNYYNSSIIYGKTSLDQQSDYSFVCDYIVAISCPTNLIYLQISANELSKYPPDIYKNIISSNEIIDYNSYYFILPVSIKECQIGEIFDFTNKKCTFCPVNYYTFDPKSNCSICPDHANCNGTNIFYLDINYWRFSVNSTEIIHCNAYIGNCVGGYTNICSTNYQGILCTDCSNSNLFKNYMGECQECSNEVWEIFKNILFYLIFIILLLVFCLIFIIKTFDKKHHLMIKVIIIYFHCLIANFSNQVDITYNPLFQYFKLLHSLTKLSFWISTFCLFNVNAGKLFENFVIIIMVYFMLVIIFLVFRYFYNYTNARKALFIIYYIISPMIFNVFLSNVNCISIEGDYYLNDDTSTQCSDYYYELWILLFIFPHFVIFSVFLPLKIWKTLHLKNKLTVLDNKNNKVSYNDKDEIFIYTIGLNRKYYYYDILIYFRNISMIFINSYVIDINTQVSANLMILMYSFVIELSYKVYKTEIFFKMVRTIEFTFVLNNFLLMYSTNYTSSSNFLFYSIIFPILIILHTYFLILCGYMLFQGKIRRKITKKIGLNSKKRKLTSLKFQNK